MKLTVRKLDARPKDGEPDQWISDGSIRGSGALWARLSPASVSFYFRYTHEKKKKSLALGGYDEHGAKGLTLKAAREKAGEISKLYQSGITDLHGHLERVQQAEERARKDEEEAARRNAEEAERGTLRQLLEAYIGHLQRSGKQAAGDVRSIFDRHVFEAAPELAPRKATEISVDQFVGLIGRLTEAKKGRTAAKLRSYLRAAYSLAIASRTDPDAPQVLRAFGIETNPVASVGARALARYNRARDRVLSAPELGAYLRRLERLRQSAQRDALLLCMQLGGQRPTQLLRLKPVDVDLSAGTVTLYDGKGARSRPRRHVLPLTKDAAVILKPRLQTLQKDEPLFSTDQVTSLGPGTISNLVTEISSEMVKAKEAREAFQLRDIRRTCETMMAAMKVSSDVRAELQSHGLGGVQKRHYDRHEYALEKRQALEKWGRQLAKLKAGETGAVVNINAKARRS
jgi:integrase